MDRKALRNYLDENIRSIKDERERKSVISYYLDCYDATMSNPEEDVKKINNGQPVQYVTGISFFYGGKFGVQSGVLIPRPETEELVHWIRTDQAGKKGLKLLDIGTGSGCVIVSLLNVLDVDRAIAVDISDVALDLTAKNGSKYGHDIECIRWDALKDEWLPAFGRPDIVVCNPPYIQIKEQTRMDASVVIHEPQEALFVEDSDVFIFHKRILEILEKSVGSGPVPDVYFETSDLQHAEMQTYLDASAWQFEFRKDMQGKWRMLKCWKA